MPKAMVIHEVGGLEAMSWGDDTIFVVPGSAKGATALVKHLRHLLGV